MDLTEEEKRKISLNYLNELAKDKWVSMVTNDNGMDENEIRNKKFCILYRAFCDGFLQPNLKKENDKLGRPTTKEERILSDKNIEKNIYTKNNPEFWKKYRDLRNMITHTGYIRSSDFCYISEGALKIFEKEISKYIPTYTAYNICIKDVYTITDQSNLSDVLKEMNNKKYSNAPVVDENNFAKGMFSANTLLLYGNKNINSKIDIPNTKIEAFKPLYERNYQSEGTYDFIGRNDSLEKVIEKFDKEKKQGKRLEALFVTENGKQNQKIIGIITPWDMFKYISN